MLFTMLVLSPLLGVDGIWLGKWDTAMRKMVALLKKVLT